MLYIETDFSRWFTRKVFKRAEDYFKTGAAEYRHSNKNTFHFTVSGSATDPYWVVISSGDDVGRITADCTCPFNGYGYCKHIGAAVLEGLRSGYFTLLNSIELGSSAQREVIIDLDPPGAADRRVLSYSARAFGDEVLNQGKQESEDPRGKYRTIFVLEPCYDWWGTGRDGYLIRPMYQYIKKDGSGGRVVDFVKKRDRVRLSPSENTLYTSVSAHLPTGAPLAMLLHFLMAHPEITVKKRSSLRNFPCTFIPVGHAELSFTFAGFAGRQTPLFKPLVTFFCSDTSRAANEPLHTDCMVAAVAGSGCYFTSEDTGSIFYVPDDSPGNRQLQSLIHNPSTFTVSDISYLANVADTGFLSVDPPTGKIKLITAEPVLELLLQYAQEETIIDVRFTYDGCEAVSSDQYVIGKNSQLVTTLYRRDSERESQLIDTLLRIVGDVEEYDGVLVSGENIRTFVLRFGAQLLAAGFHIFERDLMRELAESGEIDIVANSGIDWLDLRVKLNGKPVSLQDIDLEAGVVRDRRGFYVLDDTALEQLRILFRHGVCDEDSVHVDPRNLSAIDELSAFVKSDDPRYQRILQAIHDLNLGFRSTNTPTPRLLTGTLREYQHAGLGWLLFLHEYGFGGILADDMGLGKTVQALALLAYLRESGDRGRYLIVVPVSTIANWLHELSRFLPSLPVYAHIGSQRPKETRFLKGYSGAVITSYHTLQRDVHLLREVRWRQLVLDESQALKNPNTKNYAVVQEIPRDNALALSGTPVENNIRELWSIMSILNPGLLGSESGFMRTYRRPVSDGDEEKICALRELLKPFIFRRTKDEVAADIPEKRIIDVPVNLTPAENRYYRILRERLRNEVEGLLKSHEPFRAGIMILQALTKLRQAAIAPLLVGGPERSSKLDLVLNMAAEAHATGHPVLIFSQYVRVLRMAEERIKLRGWPYRYLDGSLSQRKRQQAIFEFQHHEDVKIFLISLRAGGVGINLTKADYVFILDPWWNPAVENQAIDRTHRIGQKKPVFAYRFISTGTIEEQILILQEKKKELVDNIIRGDESIFKTLTKEQIISLFK